MTRTKLISLDDGTAIELDVVVNEDVKANAGTTDYPVEGGRTVADHMELDPILLSLTGVIAGDESTQKLQVLERWRDERHRLQFIGRSVLNGYVITTLEARYSVDVGDGFRFNMQLKEVRIVSPQIFEDVEEDPAPKAGFTTSPGSLPAVESQVSRVRDTGRVELVTVTPVTLAIGGDTVQVSQYLPFDKDKVPYSLQTRIKGSTFTFVFSYNGWGDYFTVNLVKGNDILVRSEKIVCGQVLFSAYRTEEFPEFSILPMTVSSEDVIATWDNMDKIRLYLFDPEDIQNE